MDRLARLGRQRLVELNKALLATTARARRRHEEQARAYAKIMAVLAREEQRPAHS